MYGGNVTLIRFFLWSKGPPAALYLAVIVFVRPFTRHWRPPQAIKLGAGSSFGYAACNKGAALIWSVLLLTKVRPLLSIYSRIGYSRTPVKIRLAAFSLILRHDQPSGLIVSSAMTPNENTKDVKMRVRMNLFMPPPDSRILGRWRLDHPSLSLFSHRHYQHWLCQRDQRSRPPALAESSRRASRFDNAANRVGSALRIFETSCVCYVDSVGLRRLLDATKPFIAC